MSNQTSFSLKMTRIVATLMIFMCHTVFLFGKTISLSAQFFNIGVSVFLFISAYLFTLRKNAITNIFEWYKKRFLRLCVPYYWLILFICLSCLITHVKIQILNVFESVLFLQGLTENYLPGGGHLWYLTAMLLSYLITPMLTKLKNSKFIFKFVFFICGFILYVLITIFTREIFSTIFIKVLEYSIYFMIIPLLNKYFNKINEKKLVVISAFCLVIFCFLKLLFNFIWDNTRFYTFYLVPITGIFIGVSIFYFVFYLTKVVYCFADNSNVIKKIVNHFDSISFEFYLVHYFFITFSINLVFNINPILNFILILLMSYCASNILHLISNETYKVVKLWKQKH